MNWFNIIKNPKLRVGSKITTNLGIDSKQEDDTCKRKLLDYQIKIQNMENSPRINKLAYITDAFEHMPEEAACKALKILNGLKLIIKSNANFRLGEVDNIKGDNVKVVVGDKEYYILGQYVFVSDGMSGTLDLQVVWNNLARNIGQEILWFSVSADGTKEEVMEMVDWR